MTYLVMKVEGGLELGAGVHVRSCCHRVDRGQQRNCATSDVIAAAVHSSELGTFMRGCNNFRAPKPAMDSFKPRVNKATLPLYLNTEVVVIGRVISVRCPPSPLFLKFLCLREPFRFSVVP